jgi:nucleotide-binding universal stress UspA family protein
MKLKKILLPSDFSHCGDEALAFATMLARDTKATLLIVHVEEPPAAYGGDYMYYGPPEPNRELLRELLEKIVPADPIVPCEHHLLFGDPAHQLVEFANKQSVDLIVIGTHGRTGLFRALMGSVAESVVRHATCPVISVKHPKHKVADEK